MSGADDGDPIGRQTASEKQELAGLLAKIAGGDLSAFEQLYRETSGKLLGACLRIVPERWEAEEALQETFLSIWRRAGLYDSDRGNAMAWLLTLARNGAVDRLRARPRFSAEPLDLAETLSDQAPLASDLMERQQDRTRIAECLDTLAFAEVTLIRAAFFQGSTYAELAERAAIPLGTVKSRIRRALVKLADCLR